MTFQIQLPLKRSVSYYITVYEYLTFEKLSIESAAMKVKKTHESIEQANGIYKKH